MNQILSLRDHGLISRRRIDSQDLPWRINVPVRVEAAIGDENIAVGIESYTERIGEHSAGRDDGLRSCRRIDSNHAVDSVRDEDVARRLYGDANRFHQTV